MAQGKVERLGWRESFRIEEKARRATEESLLRARSAMTEFHEKTSVLSTYLLKSVVKFCLSVCLSVWRRRETDEKRGFLLGTFIHSFFFLSRINICLIIYTNTLFVKNIKKNIFLMHSCIIH